MSLKNIPEEQRGGGYTPTIEESIGGDSSVVSGLFLYDVSASGIVTISGRVAITTGTNGPRSFTFTLPAELQRTFAAASDAHGPVGWVVSTFGGGGNLEAVPATQTIQVNLDLTEAGTFDIDLVARYRLEVQ